MDQTFLIEFGVVLIVAAGLGIVARLLKQPLILAYLITGIILGPFALGLVKNFDLIQNFASIGIVFLLFLIGLELNPRRLIEVGKSVLAISVVQIGILAVIYYFASIRIGLDGMAAVYFALAFTFSSTAIIVTLLSNKKDLESLHGKIIVGILLVQDFVAIILLTLFPGLKSNPGAIFSSASTQIAIKVILLFTLVFLIGKFVLPPVFSKIARSQELLFLSSLAWCFLMVIFSYGLGFGSEIGAFLAGISLAPLPFSAHISSKTKPLRDFFHTIFFVYLGSTLIFAHASKVIIPAVIFSLIIIIINPIVIMVTMSVLGFRKRTSFITGITLTQISEFSFIVVAMGNKLEILPKETMAMTSLVAIITIFVSTYLISNSTKIFHRLSPYLGIIESDKKQETLMSLPDNLENHTILVGYHSIGEIVLDELKIQKVETVVIDVDPYRINKLIEQGDHSIYGDAIDHEIMEKINVKKARMVISTLDKLEENKMLIELYRKENRKIQFVMISDDSEEALELYGVGADLVIVPSLISGDYLAYMLKRINSGEVKIEEQREREVKSIEKHQEEIVLHNFIKKTKS